MKVTMFHFMPYRDLPADFPRGFGVGLGRCAMVGYGDADKVTDSYNWSIDELMLAAKLGFDGIGTNEHHQNPYGFMCNPNLFGAILAKMTARPGLGSGRACPARRHACRHLAADPHRRGIRGARLHQRRPPGRRLCPLGLGYDANISYGITPMEQRERWREAIDLMLKAWTAKEFFAWNGKYFQLPKVNLWPRPVQDPHPPVLIPGAASSSTWDYCHDRNFPTPISAISAANRRTR